MENSSHLDHFSAGSTLKLFKTTGAPVLAEAEVADELKGKIPNDKLTTAMSGLTYTYGDLIVKAVQGVHRGPIMLFQVKMGDLLVFHAGDSGYVPVKDLGNGAPIKRASVRVTINDPINRVLWTSSSTTNSNGLSTLTPRLSIAAMKGTYTVTATVTYSGYSTGTGHTTFRVK